MDIGLRNLRAASGGAAALSRRLANQCVFISPQAISQWRRVPAGRVLAVEKATGVPRHDLRPDLYPPPASSPGVPAELSSAGACDIAPAGGEASRMEAAE